MTTKEQATTRAKAEATARAKAEATAKAEAEATAKAEAEARAKKLQGFFPFDKLRARMTGVGGGMTGVVALAEVVAEADGQGEDGVGGVGEAGAGEDGARADVGVG